MAEDVYKLFLWFVLQPTDSKTIVENQQETQFSETILPNLQAK